jgi:uncharacterized membrane protein
VIAPAIVAIAAGCILVWLAVVSWRGRLSRNWFAGVRTPSTLRSAEAFAVANKAAAPLTGAGGLVMILGGALTMVVPRHLLGVPLFAGVLAGVALCIAGGVIGVRACK